MSPVARPTFHGRDALSWFFLFRLLLVLALLVMVSLPSPSTWLPDLTDAHGARVLLLVQAALVLAGGLMSLIGWPPREQQVQLAIYLDLIAAILLIHLSGGVGAGFGLLPAVAVAWGALLLEGRQSLLFAALASLGVIAQQIYSELYLETYRGSYLEAGLLGATYFSVAALAHVLSRRLRESEQLAASQQLDIADLSTLSAYVIRELGIGVLFIDAERRIKLFNTTAQRLLGGSDWRSGLALCRAAPQLETWIEQATLGEPGSNSVLRIRDQHIQASLHLLGSQGSNGALIYLRDEQDAMREAQDVNLAALGRLSASLAHNIRNPLAAVTHGSQLLAESPRLDADDQRLLAIVRRNARRLDEIVRSVLDLSNRHRAEPTRLELGQWLREVCGEYRDAHSLSGQSFVLSLTSQPLHARVDPRHLRQILTNLWDNARAHGCDGQGRCRINTQLEAGINSEIFFLRVSDSGSGVPIDRRQTIFEPFFTTSSQGTGLGLYAAKALAEANGVRLEYSDVNDAGACFTLTFRITPSDG
jgi:two-component system sensor histidine kinase PilS (NtrC family)